MSLNGDRARHYRELIFDCAERIFAEHGFAHTRMEEIAAAAGISLRTLYLAYPGKQEIYAAIEETRVSEMLERSRSEMRGAGSPPDRLRRVVTSYVGFLAVHRNYLLMHLRQGNVWTLSLDDQIGSPELRWTEAIPGLVRIFRTGIEQGFFHPGEPELMARMMLAVQQIQLAEWARQAAPPAADLLIEEILLQIKRSFFIEVKAEGIAPAALVAPA